jgi:hypothetical protein
MDRQKDSIRDHFVMNLGQPVMARCTTKGQQNSVGVLDHGKYAVS